MSEIYMFHRNGFLVMSLEKDGWYNVRERNYALGDVELNHSFRSRSAGLEYMSDRAGRNGFDIGELR